MAETKAETLARLQALLDSGTLSTTFDGETTSFQSPDHLRRRIRELQVELGLRRRRRRVFGFGMGNQ